MEKIKKLLAGKGDNYIFSFFWLHGETEDVLRKYMKVIYNSNIRAVCVESRPHPDFCGEKWWKDMNVILEEAERLDMKVWILDDSHFPTGFANGAMEKQPDMLCRQSICCRTYDITGQKRLYIPAEELRHPIPFEKTLLDEHVMQEPVRTFEDDRLLGLVAIKWADVSNGKRVEKKMLCENLIPFVKEERLDWEAPEGKWRVFALYLSRNYGYHRSYVNMLSRPSCKVLLDAVYEPHYMHYGRYFGNTIEGFFSDEPELGNGHIYDIHNIFGTEQADYPWSDELEQKLAEKFGGGGGLAGMLALLWETEGDACLTARVRYAYMDAVTRLVRENFSFQIAEWCHEHNVKYIGHFESDSTFVLGGFPDVVKQGRVLVDGMLYHKDASPEQFPWHCPDYCTEKRGENLYLAEVPEAYFVSYDANNNAEGASDMCSDPNKYTGGDTVTIMDQEALFPLMGNIVRFGYDFVGWNTEPDGSGTDYAPGQETSLTGNLYLYAKWEAKEPVTLTYIYNDGEGRTDSAQVIPGANIAFPDASRKGYRFMGWYEDEALTAFAGNAGDKHYAPQQDASYYAAWEKAEATVTFDADGGEMEGGDITAKIGDTITLPECTKEDYIFTGWYDGDTCIGQAGEDYTVSDDVILKAHYEKKEAAICTITFDADGGKMEGGTIIAKEGDAVILPNCTKEGYKFTGWYDGDRFIGKAGEEYAVSADVTLKAHYEKEKEEEKPVICTVTFDADGGETVRKSISTEKGSAVILPLCSKTGYEFLGWFLASDENICAGQAGEEFTVQGDITLKAHFEKKEAVKVTITFDADGGKEVKPIKAAKGDIIRLPKTEKEGYSFLGWYTEKEGGILLGIPGSEMKAVKDITAYALWEKEAEKETDHDTDSETCKVAFHAGKGTIKVKELTIIKDGSLYLPMPEREGYDFAGWYLDDGLTQFAGAYHDTYRITKDTDFYAKWEKSKDNGSNNGDSGNSGNTGDENGGNADNGDDTQDSGNSGETLNTYTIKYDANGGKTKNASVKVVKGGSVRLPNAEREGYIFKGWYTDRQVFIGTEGETYKPGRSISLYARWEKAGKDNQNSQDDSTGKTNDKDNKNTLDKDKNTNGTVSGNSAGSPSDKDTDTNNAATKTEGGNGNDGKGSEPVIQTGHASPFTLLAALGLCDAVLIGASVLEAKKDGKAACSGCVL